MYSMQNRCYKSIGFFFKILVDIFTLVSDRHLDKKIISIDNDGQIKMDPFLLQETSSAEYQLTQ